MSYIVLARKYRPNNFDEVVGQRHITGILKKAIETNRLAHAFLFCGPRGIGKTSCARILAKALNCAKGPTASPCGQCPACTEIAKGNSFDVIEIDGASNRGIDEIRTIRENVKFAPGLGRYKVYIVDEVHMLTTEAFNALLKTLEEPPEHVKFIFATTEPHKLPSTIISRCQRFDFKRISLQALMDVLAGICKKEKLQIDQDALMAIAKSALGSLRDGLSVLDQLSSLSEKKIQLDDVVTMLGVVETDLLFELTDCLSRKDACSALEVFDNIVDQGKDIKQLNRDLIEHFRNLMVIKIGGQALGKLVDYPVAVKEKFLAQSKDFSLGEILQAIEMFIEAQETARVMQSIRIPLEVAFARFISRDGVSKHPGLPEGEAPGDPQKNNIPPRSQGKNVHFTSRSMLTNKKGHVDFSPKINAEDEREEEEPMNTSLVDEKALAGQGLDVERVRKSWNALIYAVSRQKMSVASYLQEGSPYKVDTSKIIISFPQEAAFNKETLEEKDNLLLIETVFSEQLKTQIKIELRVFEDHKPNDHEPDIQKALDTFKGKIVNKWYRE